ncbi:MAG: hypothetical protein AAGA56_04015 [Myxococcota bacterium]
MKKLTLFIHVALVGAFIASPVKAEGLMFDASALAESDRQRLAAQIAQAKRDDPEAFSLVRGVKGYKPEHYRRFRRPIPLVSRELKRIGPRAVMPLIEAIAFRGWERGRSTHNDWAALRAGMLDALGSYRDSRATAVLVEALRIAQRADVRAGAARGLGHVCDDQASRTLMRASQQPALRRAGWIGLGHCRREESVRRLAAELGQTRSQRDVVLLGRALGHAASSWGWAADGPARQREGLRAREAATVAAGRAIVKFGGDVEVRRSLSVALTMAAHPEARRLLAAPRRQASVAVAEQLDAVIATIERRSRR